MQNNDERPRLTDGSATYHVTEPGLLGKVFAFAAGAALLVVGLVFSVFILTVAAVVALGVLGYIWWATRDLRRQLRERAQGSRVIDGEVIRDE